MLHWIEGEDERGLPVWLRYLECSHWGLILTGTKIRWLAETWPAYPSRVVNLACQS